MSAFSNVCSPPGRDTVRENVLENVRKHFIEMSVESFQLANTVIDKMLQRGNTVMRLHDIKTEVDTSRLTSDGDRDSGNLLLRIEQLAIFRNL